MTRDEINSALTGVFREVLQDPEVTLFDEMTANDHDAWDSMSHIHLIIEVEKHFGVRFRNSEIARLQNVGDLVKLISTKKAG